LGSSKSSEASFSGTTSSTFFSAAIADELVASVMVPEIS